MLECSLCQRAIVEPYIGEIDDHCRGCRVRYASTLPRHARVKLFEHVRIMHGDAAAHRWQVDVSAEYERRKRLSS